MIGAIAKGDGDTVAPDIVFIGYSYPGKSYGIEAHAEALAPFKNITCIGLDFFYPENMTSDMEKLGIILNKEAEAKEYINWYNQKLSDIKEAVKGTTMPKVYVEWTAKGNDLSGMGRLLEQARWSRLPMPTIYSAGERKDIPRSTGSISSLRSLIS